MAAKDIDPLVDGIDNISIEAGAQDWVITCGVCHVGGGQMEYDRDGNPYTSASADGDAFMFEYPSLDNQNPSGVTPGFMTDNAANKAEVDCLMCHLDYSTLAGGANGRHLLQTWGCDDLNPLGPMNDPTCADANIAAAIPAGAGYDMYNRNLALKGRNLGVAASMGLGAVGTVVPDTTLQNGFTVSGVTWPNIPTIVGADMIAGTPNSANCSPCHARDENTPGLPGMMGMKYGFGNFLLSSAPNTQVDYDDPKGDASNANDVNWLDFGCKTGMGKRTHKIGAGPNANWGMSMFNNMFGLGKNPGDPILTETLAVNNPLMVGAGITEVNTKERMPDADVHDMGGLSCGTCHYALGSDQGAYTVGSGGAPIDIPAGEFHHVDYPAETIKSMDHQFAQGDSYPDTKGKNNLDGTVYCGMCHMDRTHPKVLSGEIDPPTPTHPALPAFHLDKIACSTCHIPEVYGAPGRLKYRDWTVGVYKGSFRNMLDWNFDLITGGHKPMPVVRKWLTKFGQKQIYPVLPSVMPIWLEVVGNNPATPPLDFEDTPFPTAATIVGPVKHRDTTIAARDLLGSGFDIRLNGGNAVPLFDGFVLADSWEIDTKAEIDAMMAAFNDPANPVNLAKGLKLMQADFDVTHGIVTPEWALGGGKRGGCASCHSSANPADPDYSPHSVAFFEGSIQPLDNGMSPVATSQAFNGYDVVKNWFALFADYDCTALCGMGTLTDADLFNPNGTPITGTACNPMSIVPDIDACVAMMSSTFDDVMGFPAGTAQLMGMYDGIAGLQGFTIRETTTGSLDADGNGDLCNPFAGAASLSPFPGYSVNACVANTMNAGTCINMGPSGMGFDIGQCDANSFRAGGMCSNATGNANADCNGTLADTNGDLTRNPMGLLYSRAEVRSHFKINLQQSNPGSGNRVTWPVGGEQNPSNLNHVNSWDQAVDSCLDYSGGNPMAPGIKACADGDSISTIIPANRYLGYTEDSLATLKSSQSSAYFADLDARFSWVHSFTIARRITFDRTTSKCPPGQTCTYTWNYGGTGTEDLSNPAKPVYVYDTAGQYTVTLTVADEHGYSDSQTQTTVKADDLAPPAEPAASAVDTGTGGVVDLTVTAGESNLNALYVVWGDGSGFNYVPARDLASITISNTYAPNGTYDIKLYVFDMNNGWTTLATTVDVTSAP